MVVTITSAYGGSYGTKKPKPYWWCGRDRDNALVHDLIARGHLLFKDQFLLKLYAKWWQFIWRQIKIKVAYMLDASKKNKCRGLAKCVRWDLQFVSTWGNEMSRGKEGIQQRDDAIYMARHLYSTDVHAKHTWTLDKSLAWINMRPWGSRKAC